MHRVCGHVVHPDFEECVPIDTHLFKQWAELLLFDLQCLAAVATKPKAFSSLHTSSYMMDSAGLPALDPAQQMRRLCMPLCHLLAQQPLDTPVILSCQEMSPRIESMAALRGALPKGLDVFIRIGSASTAKSVADSVFTGFIYPRSVTFKDATDQLLPQCAQLMSSIGLPERVATTTLQKLCIGVFDFEGKGERKLAVVNVHLKKQPGLAAKRALCVGGLIQIALELEGVVEAVCAGDVNVESRWPDDFPQQQRLEAAMAAPPGTIPKALLPGGPLAFDEALAEQGLQQRPPYNAFTSIKMRTCFQAQPMATDDLVLGHKDVVVMRTEGRIRVLDTIVGGLGRKAKTPPPNLDSLIPSREWPADHFLPLCTAELY